MKKSVAADIEAGFTYDDRPLTSLTDLTDLDPYGLKMHCRILSDELLRLSSENKFNGQVIGINAPWGGGKTTLMNLVREILTRPPETDDDGYPERREEILKGPRETPAYQIDKYAQSGIIFAEAQVWTDGDEADVSDIFFNAIWRSLDRAGKLDTTARLKKFSNTTVEVINKFSPAASTLFQLSSLFGKAEEEEGGGGVKVDVDTGTLGFSPRNILMDFLKRVKGKTKLIVIIDDFDRLRPERIEQVIAATWWLKELDDTLVMFLYDQKRVTEALGSVLFQHYNSEATEEAARYLEKIVQFNYEVPPPTPKQLVKDLLKRQEDLGVLHQHNNFGPKSRADVANDFLLELITTPRALKTMINSVEAFKRMHVTGMIDRMDFLVLHALRLFDNAKYHEVISIAGRISDWRKDPETLPEKDPAARHKRFFFPSLYEYSSKTPYEESDGVNKRFGFGCEKAYKVYLSGMPESLDEFCKTAAHQVAMLEFIPNDPAGIALCKEIEDRNCWVQFESTYTQVATSSFSQEERIRRMADFKALNTTSASHS